MKELHYDSALLREGTSAKGTLSYTEHFISVTVLIPITEGAIKQNAMRCDVAYEARAQEAEGIGLQTTQTHCPLVKNHKSKRCATVGSQHTVKQKKVNTGGAGGLC